MAEGKRDEFYDKTRYELLEPSFIDRLAKTATFGDAKYGRHNWRKFKGDQITDIARHAYLHITKFMQGDTSEDHIAHAACNLMFLAYFESLGINVMSPLADEALSPTETLLNTYQLPNAPTTPKETAKQGYTVYLAGPIDGTSEEKAGTWRSWVSDRLQAAGVTCFSPFHAVRYAGGAKPAAFIQSVNEHAIHNSDLILVYLPLDQATVGTVMELMLAHSIGKQVLIISEKDFSYLRWAPRVEGFEQAVQTILAYYETE